MSPKTGRQAAVQGKLDGLCGIYSIINSISLIEKNHMSQEDRKALFVYLVDLLDDGRGIGTIIQSGISFRLLGKLIDVASRWRASRTKEIICRQTAMKRVPDDIEDFWSVLANHVDMDKRQVAILGISGKYDHWTVVRSVSRKRLTLHDSDGLKHLDIGRCGLEPGKQGNHVLWSTQTYLLRVEEDRASTCDAKVGELMQRGR